MKTVILLLIALGASSCRPGMKKEVKARLEERYGEEFKVNYDVYSYVLKTYSFQAAPKRNKKLVFGGEHNEKMTHFIDGYAREYLGEQLTQRFKNIISEYTSPVYVFCNYGYYSVADSVKVHVDTLDIEKILKNQPSIFLDIYCYVFKELTEDTKEELLTGIYKIIEPYKTHPNANVAVRLSFFKPEFMGSHTMSYFNFDRRKSSVPRILANDWRYITQKLNLYLRTDEPFHDFTIDTLYKYVQKVTPEHFGVPPTNLNEIYKKSIEGK